LDHDVGDDLAVGASYLLLKFGQVLAYTEVNNGLSLVVGHQNPETEEEFDGAHRQKGHQIN